LKTIETQKSAFFSQQVAYVQLKFGQNQGLWSQNGDTMSPDLGGVFSVHEEGDFSKNSGILQLAKMGSFWAFPVTILWFSFAAVTL